MKVFVPVFGALFFLFINAVSAKYTIDTIDYWHIFYNNKMVGKFNEVTKNPSIVIKSDEVKLNDFIKIQYGDDTPDKTISTGIYVLANQKKVILSEGKGTGTPLKITLKEIVDVADRNHCDFLDFYYFDSGKRNKLIFTLKLLKK